MSEAIDIITRFITMKLSWYFSFDGSKFYSEKAAGKASNFKHQAWNGSVARYSLMKRAGKVPVSLGEGWRDGVLWGSFDQYSMSISSRHLHRT